MTNENASFHMYYTNTNLATHRANRTKTPAARTKSPGPLLDHCIHSPNTSDTGIHRTKLATAKHICTGTRIHMTNCALPRLDAQNSRIARESWDGRTGALTGRISHASTSPEAPLPISRKGANVVTHALACARQLPSGAGAVMTLRGLFGGRARARVASLYLVLALRSTRRARRVDSREHVLKFPEYARERGRMVLNLAQSVRAVSNKNGPRRCCAVGGGFDVDEPPESGSIDGLLVLTVLLIALLGLDILSGIRCSRYSL